MTVDELVQKLNEIAESQKSNRTDKENDHLDADGLLLAFIDNQRVNDAFGSIDTWYA